MKTFLASLQWTNWDQELILNGESIRRFASAMTLNKAPFGSKDENPCQSQKFNLGSIKLSRSGFSIASTPLQADNDKKLYLISLEALAFKTHSHGVPFADFPNHYVLAFDQTSTQKTSLTN